METLKFIVESDVKAAVTVSAVSSVVVVMMPVVMLLLPGIDLLVTVVVADSEVAMKRLLELGETVGVVESNITGPESTFVNKEEAVCTTVVAD